MIAPATAQSQLDTRAYDHLAAHYPNLIVLLALRLQQGQTPRDIYRQARAGGNDPGLCSLMWAAAQHMLDQPAASPLAR